MAIEIFSLNVEVNVRLHLSHKYMKTLYVMILNTPKRKIKNIYVGKKCVTVTDLVTDDSIVTIWIAMSLKMIIAILV